MKKVSLLAGRLVVLLVCLCSSAQGASDEAVAAVGYREQAERFMNLIKAEKFSEAIDTLFSTNPWMAGQPDQMASVKEQMSGMKELLGEVHGCDLIAEQQIGDAFVYLVYVARFDRSPISFHMAFYRPDDHWIAYNMEFKKDVLDMAKEITRRKLTTSAEGS